MNQNKIGIATGTGAAITVPLGWVPDYIKVWNITDGDEVFEYFRGMAAGHALRSGNHASTQFSRITSNGFTIFDGSAANQPSGFVLGTAISENGKTLGWKAERNGPGGF